MKGAGELNAVHEWPELPAVKRFRDMPGRAAVLMCPKPETSEGGIYLTDRTSGNLRPDAGIVTASADIPEGMRCYVRPYTGMLYDSPEGWYRLLGREAFKGEEWLSVVDIYEHIVAFDIDGEIIPTPGNVLVEFTYRQSVIQTLQKTRENAVVRSVGEFSEYQAGDVVAVVDSPDFLQFGDYWLLPESCIGVKIEQAA